MAAPDTVRIRRLAVAAATAALLATAGAAAAQAAPIPDLPAPTDVRVEPGSPTRAEEITVTWAAPDDLPDGTTTHWALCNDGDIAPDEAAPNGCGAPNPGIGADRSITIATPNEIVGTVWVWFEDAEGNEGPATRKSVVIDRTAPGPPTDVRWGTGPYRFIAPGDYRPGDAVVRWANPIDGAAPISRVHWRFCRSWSGNWAGFPEQCRTGAGDPTPFLLDESPVPAGAAPHHCVGHMATVTLWLEDAAGNVDPANAGLSGVGANPGCAPWPPGGGPKADPPAAPRARTSLSVDRRVRTIGKAGKRRQRVTITATAEPGDASGTVRLRVTGRQGKRTLSRTRSVRLASGRASFTLTVPKGLRRLSVKATYAGSTTHAPSSRTTTVRIPR